MYHMTMCVFFIHGIVPTRTTVPAKRWKKGTRLEQFFAQNLRSENWREWNNIVAAKLWGLVSRRPPQVYTNNKTLLSLPFPSQPQSHSHPNPNFIKNLSSEELYSFSGEKKGTNTLSLAEAGTEVITQKNKPNTGSRTESSLLLSRLFLSVTPPLVSFFQDPPKKEQLPPTSLQPNFKFQLLICHSLFHEYSFYLCTELMVILPLFNVCLVIYMFSLYLHISVSPTLASRFLKAGHE